MKHSIPPWKSNAPEPPKPVRHPDPKISDISLDELLGKSLLILYREIRSLTEESTKGKLCKDSAQSLRDYIKLMNELKDKEKELLENLTNEQLKELANEDPKSGS